MVNHGREFIEDDHTGEITGGGETWMKNHRGEIMEEESWRKPYTSQPQDKPKSAGSY